MASLDASRSAERLATASSALSAVTTEQERIRVFWTLSDGSSRLKQLLAESSDGGLRQRQLAAIEFWHDQHGGTLEVESEPGSFTEFIVRLPRRRPAQTGERAS